VFKTLSILCTVIAAAAGAALAGSTSSAANPATIPAKPSRSDVSIAAGLAGGQERQVEGAFSFTEFPVSPDSAPFEIIAGPACDIWFGETKGPNILGRIDPSGRFVEYSFDGLENRAPGGMTKGPKGKDIWFTESMNDKIAKIDRHGNLTEFVLPDAGTFPQDITVGPDGNLWFTAGFAATLPGSEGAASKIGRITPDGKIKEFALNFAEGAPHEIVTGPDGNLWFTRPLGNRIARITTEGVVTNFTVPTPNSRPDSITLGPDNALWFTERLADKIGRITTDGRFTEYPLPTFAGGTRRPAGITTGPDGNIWTTELLAKSIARITPDGAVSEFPVPGGATPAGITPGSDGNIWFTEPAAARIGRLDIGGPRDRGNCKSKR
jgi:streptogramin lyase